MPHLDGLIPCRNCPTGRLIRNFARLGLQGAHSRCVDQRGEAFEGEGECVAGDNFENSRRAAPPRRRAGIAPGRSIRRIMKSQLSCNRQDHVVHGHEGTPEKDCPQISGSNRPPPPITGEIAFPHIKIQNFEYAYLRAPWP